MLDLYYQYMFKSSVATFAFHLLLIPRCLFSKFKSALILRSPVHGNFTFTFVAVSLLLSFQSTSNSRLCAFFAESGLVNLNFGFLHVGHFLLYSLLFWVLYTLHSLQVCVFVRSDICSHLSPLFTAS